MSFSLRSDTPLSCEKEPFSSIHNTNLQDDKSRSMLHETMGDDGKLYEYLLQADDDDDDDNDDDLSSLPELDATAQDDVSLLTCEDKLQQLQQQLLPLHYPPPSTQRNDYTKRTQNNRPALTHVVTPNKQQQVPASSSSSSLLLRSKPRIPHKQLSHKDVSLEQLETQHARFKIHYEQLQKEYNRRIQELQDLKEELQVEQYQKEQVTRDLQSCQTVLDKRNKEYQWIQLELEHLSKQLLMQKEDNSKLLESNQDYKTRLATLEQQQQQEALINDELKTCRQQLRDSQQELTLERQRNQALETENQFLRDQPIHNGDHDDGHELASSMIVASDQNEQNSMVSSTVQQYQNDNNGLLSLLQEVNGYDDDDNDSQGMHVMASRHSNRPSPVKPYYLTIRSNANPRQRSPQTAPNNIATPDTHTTLSKQQRLASPSNIPTLDEFLDDNNTKPLMQHSMELAESLLGLLHQDTGNSIEEESRVWEQLEALSSILQDMDDNDDDDPDEDNDQVVTNQDDKSDMITLASYQRLQDRCHYLESERKELLSETLDLMESAREANAAEFQVVMASLRDQADQEVQERVEATLKKIAQLAIRPQSYLFPPWKNDITRQERDEFSQKATMDESL